MITQGVFLSTVWCFTSYTSHCTRPSIRIISFRKSCAWKNLFRKIDFGMDRMRYLRKIYVSPSFFHLQRRRANFAPLWFDKMVVKTQNAKEWKRYFNRDTIFYLTMRNQHMDHCDQKEWKSHSYLKMNFKCNNDLVVYSVEKLYRP